MVWAAVIPKQSPRKQHVFSEHGLAVRKTRPGIKVESDVGSRVVSVYAFRQQPIKRKSLIIAPRHQAFDHIAPDLLHSEALYDQRIDAVEGAEQPLHNTAPFRRI